MRVGESPCSDGLLAFEHVRKLCKIDVSTIFGSILELHVIPMVLVFMVGAEVCS